MNFRYATFAAASIFFISLSTVRADEGKSVTISVDGKPAFSLTLPAGWKVTEPADLKSIISDEALEITGQFDKLGELDAEAAKKKGSSEAQMFLAMGGDNKDPKAPEATDKEIAGNKGFSITESYKSSDKTKTLKTYGFTVDGKTYYELVLQGPEEKVAAGDEMAESITAAK